MLQWKNDNFPEKIIVFEFNLKVRNWEVQEMVVAESMVQEVKVDIFEHESVCFDNIKWLITLQWVLWFYFVSCEYCRSLCFVYIYIQDVQITDYKLVTFDIWVFLIRLSCKPVTVGIDEDEVVTKGYVLHPRSDDY